MNLSTKLRASLVAQTVKNLPAMQAPPVGSLGWKDPLEVGMATHPSTLAWRIPWTEDHDKCTLCILEIFLEDGMALAKIDWCCY